MFDSIKKQKNIDFGQLKQKNRMSYYSKPSWKKLAYYKRVQSPLCELCQVEDKITGGEEVHHLIKWNDQIPSLKETVLLAENNLITVCNQCHQNIHYRPNNLTEKQQIFLKEHKEKVFNEFLLNNIIVKMTEDKNFVDK